MPNHAEHLRAIRDLCERQGVRSALQYMNGLTEHRFTSLYRFDGEQLENVFFFDRENPGVLSSPTIPVMASYCVFVRDSKRSFSTPNSGEDTRVSGHPKRYQVQSYIGVPLVNDDGVMFGTICHFNLGPMPVSDKTVALMEGLAPFLARRVGPPAA